MWLPFLSEILEYPLRSIQMMKARVQLEIAIVATVLLTAPVESRDQQD